MARIPPIPADPDSTVFGNTYDMALMITRRAIKKSKPPVSAKQFQIPVVPGCWIDLNVTLTNMSVRAVGVVEPGKSVSPAVAAASRDSDSNFAIGCSGIAMIGIVAVIGVDRGLTSLAGVICLAVMGAIVALLAWTIGRKRRARQASRLLGQPDPSFDSVLRGINRLGQINIAVDQFGIEMKKSTKQGHLEPLSLPDSVRAAPQGIHQSLWEIAKRGTEVDQEALTAGIEAVTQVVFDTIETTWEAFEGFTVPIPEAPAGASDEHPEPPAVDAVRLLKEIAEQIETDRAAAQQTNEDIARINRPESDAES